MAASPGVIPHLWLQGGAVAMAVDILAGLAGGGVLWLRHTDNGPLTIDLDVDGMVEVASFPITCSVNAIGVTIVAGVLANPLGACQTGVATGLHAYRPCLEVGQRVGPWPVMAAIAGGVGG